MKEKVYVFFNYLKTHKIAFVAFICVCFMFLNNLVSAYAAETTTSGSSLVSNGYELPEDVPAFSDMLKTALEEGHFITENGYCDTWDYTLKGFVFGKDSSGNYCFYFVPSKLDFTVGTKRNGMSDFSESYDSKVCLNGSSVYSKNGYCWFKYVDGKWSATVGGYSTNAFSVITSTLDIYTDDTYSDISFPTALTSRVVGLSAGEVVKKTMSQTVSLIPLLIVFLVSLIALLKGLQMLSRVLRQA